MEYTDLEYNAQQDLFCIHIREIVNPARKGAGLDEISDSQAVCCFRILEDFKHKWNGTGTTIDNSKEVKKNG